MDIQDPVIVETDVLPPAWNPAGVREHAGRVVAALCERPLWCAGRSLTDDSPLLRELNTEDGGRTWIAELDASAIWSDGSPMMPTDCAEALAYHFGGSSRHPLARYFRGLGARVEVQGPADASSRLCITLARPVACFDTLLAGHSVWAVHRTHRGVPPNGARHVSSGMYSLDALLPRDKGFVLKRCKARGSSIAEHPLPNTIVLYKTDCCAEGVDLYECGRLHLTCNTWLDAATATALKDRPDFLSDDLSMAAVLQVHPQRLSSWVAAHSLHALSAAIDREKIARAQQPLLKPLHRFCDLWATRPSRPPLLDAAATLPRHGRKRLTLIYARYSPNHEVVAAVVECLTERFGVCIDALGLEYLEFVDRFGKGDFDLAYALQTASFDHPMALYARHLGAPLQTNLDAVLSDDLLELESMVGAAPDDLCDRIEAAWMVRYSQLPLFQVRSNYLSAHTSLRYQRAGLIRLGA